MVGDLFNDKIMSINREDGSREYVNIENNWTFPALLNQDNCKDNELLGSVQCTITFCIKIFLYS